MKKFSFVMALLIGLGAGCCCTSGDKQQAKSLFNGRDLAGWVMMHGGEWTVADGVLIGRNGKDWSTNPEKSGSWLRSKQQHGDFILELDYAINQGGNSGVIGMAYRAMVNSLSPSEGVRGGSKTLNLVIPYIGATFPFTQALSSDFGREGKLNDLSTLPTARCSSEPASW